MQNNYKFKSKRAFEEACKMDPSKPRTITLQKKIRRVEQESRISHESFEQMFQRVPIVERPYDQYEKDFLALQQQQNFDQAI